MTENGPFRIDQNPQHAQKVLPYLPKTWFPSHTATETLHVLELLLNLERGLKKTCKTTKFQFKESNMQQILS